MNNFSRSDPIEIARHASDLGLTFNGDRLDELVESVDEALVDYRVIDELASMPESESRLAVGVRRPTPLEDPLHAWEWKFELEPTSPGILSGTTVGVKATIEVAGVPVSVGNDLVHHTPRRHSVVVERLLHAGATIVGTTRLTDFENDGAGVTGPRHPLTDNASRPGYLPGGSSSGSAAVVTAGEVDVAIGADSGGSIREPASWSGCVGLKPTHGLVPPAGAITYDPILSDLGPMARTVRECAAVLNVIADGSSDYAAGLDGNLAGWRIGVLQEGFDVPLESDPTVDALVREHIEALAGSGATIVPVSVPRHRAGVAIWSGIANEGTYTYVAENAVARTHNRMNAPTAYMDALAASLRDSADRYPLTRASMLVMGRYLTADPGRRRYSVARELALSLRRDYDAALDYCDVLVMPTTPRTSRPAPATKLSARDLLRTAAGSFHNAAPFNATGHPALSVPIGQVDGLPVGMMLVGRHLDEAKVLQAGHRAMEASARSASAQGAATLRS